MNRRLFLSSALALAACIADALAEPQNKTVRIAFIGSVSESTAPRGVKMFWSRLRESGWIEGKNLTSESRWADGRVERLPRLAAEVVAQRIDVLVTYGTPAATAAKNATNSIPIVVLGMGDPVASGLVESLARPGGNLTGVSGAWDEAFVGKWLELLQESVSHLTTVAMIGDPGNSLTMKVAERVETVAPTRGLKIRFVPLSSADGIASALKEARRPAQALLVLSDPVTFVVRRELAALAVKHRLPTVFPLREFVDDGGLMSYGPDTAALGRRGAEYVDRILRGAMPADLPVEQPTEFTLVVNLRTAKALRMRIPQSILVRTNEVIQ